jgi:hypothetical protein
MRGTRIEKEVEICATNITNIPKYMSTNKMKRKQIQFPKCRVSTPKNTGRWKRSNPQ